MVATSVSLSQLLTLFECQHIDISDNITLHSTATLAGAKAGQVSFLANKRYRRDLQHTQASVVLVDHATYTAWQNDVLSCPALLVSCADPHLAFAFTQQFFHPFPTSTGICHPSAIIHPDAVLLDNVEVGAMAVIGAGTHIGEGCIIGAGVVIGSDCTLQEDCLIHARAVIADGCLLGRRVILQSGAVIGSDGFGYAWDGQAHVKIPQTGRVILHDDVEIGANACIDRGAVEDTVIHNHVKIDNLVQLGHNVEVGAMTVIVSQAGVAGSSSIGQGCQIGGQSGIAGHLHIADGCKIAGQSGVIGDLNTTGTYGGTPAITHRAWLRGIALVNRLPELFKKRAKGN
jgi:UDP-3-O-[3-hydroxymyristoyl] glucosamine N-acyltransferase